MEAKELRELKAEELSARVNQWREELFRSRFKARTSETKDTSIIRKLRRDIARALTVLNEKGAPAPAAAQVAAPVVEDKPKKAKKPAAAKAKSKTAKKEE